MFSVLVLIDPLSRLHLLEFGTRYSSSLILSPKTSAETRWIQCWAQSRFCSACLAWAWLTALFSRSIKVNGADCGAESILLGVVTSIGGFLFGYDTGQISGMLLFEDFINRFAQGPADDKKWVPIIQSLVVSLMSIGCLLGSLSGA